MHTLGRIDDPAVRAEVDGIAAHGHVLVHVRPPPGTRPPQIGDRVTSVIPQGLVIEPTRGQPLLVPREQVTSLSRYNHVWGTGDGAIVGGIAGFVAGLTLGVLATNAGNSGCSDDCAGMSKDPVMIGLAGGAIVGGLAAVLGAAFGALAGHEDRFEISSAKP